MSRKFFVACCLLLFFTFFVVADSELGEKTDLEKLADKFDVSSLKDSFVLDSSVLVKEYPDDSLTYEIGSVGADKLVPELRVSKWDEVSLVLNYSGLGESDVSFVGDQIVFNSSFGKLRLYDLSDGFEYELVFESKPKNNVFEFGIKGDGLTFYYQPPLNNSVPDVPEVSYCNETHCLDARGDTIVYRRPEAVGSYAVYHRSVSGDYSGVGGQNYGTGKTFHIYRPKTIDSKGVEHWADMEVSGGVLRVTIPEEVLESAVYPLVLDPVIGRNTTGATDFLTYIGRIQCWQESSNTTVSGDVTEMWAHVGGTTGNNIQLAIYNGTAETLAGKPFRKYVNTSSFSTGDANTWYSTTTLTNHLSLQENKLYWFCWTTDTNSIPKLTADEVGYTGRHKYTTISGFGWPNDVSGYSWTTWTYVSDIFAVYGPTGDVVNPVGIISLNQTTVAALNGSINVSWTVFDETAISFANFNVTFPNGTLLFNSTMQNDSVILVSYKNLSVSGAYNVSLWCNDSSGNVNWSRTQFSVSAADTCTPPVSGDWFVNDDCNWTTTLFVPADTYLNCSGAVELRAVFNKSRDYHIFKYVGHENFTNCTIHIVGGVDAGIEVY